MTNQHPLTEEMMEKIHRDEPEYSNPYDEDDMRAAYDLGFEKADKGSIKYVIRSFSEGYDKGSDDRLDKAIEWLKDNLSSSLYLMPVGYSGVVVDVNYVIEDLREAMRLTTTQEDS